MARGRVPDPVADSLRAGLSIDATPACPACAGDTEPAFAARDYNRRCSRRVFHYARCRRCRLIFLADPPDDLVRYYDGDYYRFPPRDELHAIATKSRYELDMLTAWTAGGRLVEIGPAQGVFALQAATAGFDVTAIEMDARCCAYLESVVGVQAVNSDRPEEALRALAPSEAIVMWQVIEHLPDPWRVLDGAADNLREGGILLVATPNPAALGLRLLGRYWPHVDAPRHLQLIPAELLSDQLAARGLQRVALWTDDPGARSWNRFGWQRVLMNLSSRRTVRGAMFVLGALVAAVLAPVERRGRRASSYTAVFRKGAVAR